MRVENKLYYRLGKSSLEISPVVLQNSTQFFLLPTDRFQAQAVNNLKIIFFIWNIVSGVLKKIGMEDKHSQELNDFLLGNQNFSIKEFTRKNGFYLNSSTLLECEFFGKPCYPQVNTFIYHGGDAFLPLSLKHLALPATTRFPFTVSQWRKIVLLQITTRNSPTDCRAACWTPSAVKRHFSLNRSLPSATSAQTAAFESCHTSRLYLTNFSINGLQQGQLEQSIFA